MDGPCAIAVFAYLVDPFALLSGSNVDVFMLGSMLFDSNRFSQGLNDAIRSNSLQTYAFFTGDETGRLMLCFWWLAMAVEIAALPATVAERSALQLMTFAPYSLLLMTTPLNISASSPSLFV